MNSILTIYTLCYGSTDFKEISRYTGLVSAGRQDRIRRFVRNEDKTSSLLSGLLVRHVLSDITNIPWNELEFSYGAYGKPYLSDRPDCCFSMSHTNGFTVMTADNLAIGIDTENFTNYFDDYIQISEQNFSEHETQTIKNADEPLKKFYDIWTSREAYVKMKGYGLDSINCQFDSLADSSEYHIITEHIGDFSVSVCCRSDISEIAVSKLDIRQILKGDQ